MLRVMFQKIWHKKWMVLCLFLGSVLLTATAVSFPLYRNGIYDRMLQDEFSLYYQEFGVWPARNVFSTISKKDKGGTAISRMEALLEDIYRQLEVTKRETIYYYSLARADAESVMEREDLGEVPLRLGYMSQLPEHINILNGSLYSDTGMDEEGYIEVIISQACMVNSKLLMGEGVIFSSLKDTKGNPIKLKITGIYEERDKSDTYWQVSEEERLGVCMMNENLFRAMFLGENAGKYTITSNYYSLFEYEKLKAEKVEHLLTQTTYLKQESSYRNTMNEPIYGSILEQFQNKKGRIDATLTILQVPVLILLCAFLFMISSQMYSVERNEISVLKSRGSSGIQIFKLYFYQSIFLSAMGSLAGIWLGSYFVKILGSARNFLEFDASRQLSSQYTRETYLYLAAAAVVSISAMTLPALKHSRLSIVKLKQQNAIKKRKLWEKLFLDIICLAVSLYGFYSFHRDEQKIVESVIQQESMDPLLYMSSSLFILGMGLLFIRLQPLLIRLIYLLGKKFWRAASYASFMEITQNAGKQQFIMLFMILTVSLGMYHATAARSILQNARANEEYLQAADIIIKEEWDTNVSPFQSMEHNTDVQYIEPDYQKYAFLEGGEAYTKVFYDDDTRCYIKDYQGRGNLTIMGIHTKEFGEITQMDDSLWDKAYYEYLNQLAMEPQGILVSSNFRELGLEIGDVVNYYDRKERASSGKIVDFVDYWPGYVKEELSRNAEGGMESRSNFLVIANLGYLQRVWGMVPYQVWIAHSGEGSGAHVYSWAEEWKVHLTEYENKENALRLVTEDPLLQGTNGVLTMGFLVMILLCGAGYLIYWIMSIRSREMIFGVLRANGMHKGELFHMLLNEQIFCGVTSILAGLGIGRLTSVFFVPMLQRAYASARQALPMKLVMDNSDMIRLYGVIVLMMAVCLVVLMLFVFKLNIAKAIKMGEE